MKISNLFTTLQISASGLKAQRKKLDIIAENIANVNTTRTAEGGPYRRKIVTTRLATVPRFEEVLKASRVKLKTTSPMHAKASEKRRILTNSGEMIIPQVQVDQSPFKKIYDPSHPDADADGYVLLPNVNPLVEMVDLINSSRSYEANITLIDSFKEMARQALDI
jgi:flagellar basal-body rod protein FlgC